MVDILQPCVSFNKVNTYKWYKDRCYELPEDYDPTDRRNALEKAEEFGERIPVGVIYQTDKPIFEEHFAALKQGPLYKQGMNREALKKILNKYM